MYCSLLFTLIEGDEQGYANPLILAIFWPDPSIRRYFRSNPDPHYLKTFHGLNIVHIGIYICFLFLLQYLDFTRSLPSLLVFEKVALYHIYK